jgi:3'-phosphoadenosine 5'-phosphosulfate sulfotransferase (PAPS reductase)/FAD synthetase
MFHLIIFSGSPASAVCAKIVSSSVDAGGDDIKLVYCQTYSEHMDDLRFKRQVSNYLDIPIVVLADGRDIWDVCEDENRFPNGKENFCSQLLKQKVLNDFINKFISATLYFPYTKSETNAAQKTAARYSKSGFEVKFPLIENNITKDECADIIKNVWNIKLPRSYELFKDTTCFPCLNKTCIDYWITIFKESPMMFDYAMNKEKIMGNTILPDMSLEDIKKNIRKNKIILHKGAQGDLPCDCVK